MALCDKCGIDLVTSNGRHRANCPTRNKRQQEEELTINPAAVGPDSTISLDDGGGTAVLDDPNDDRDGPDDTDLQDFGGSD